ncbi:DUF397 domain-containing protein [Kitasatospora sp. RB6PN24]|uniref:DUF397 domain-containing protein n=1 Tax=Kitasatospora humi TaxID=2893891 RepID=UPI001E324830|nr:DUF397 domain-containing protein [Kitasatospora humi]MCC9306364.1 DUF397 domain-containing protein [Kitasatospora humi]
MPNALAHEAVAFRKSSYSGGNEECVECAADGTTGVAVRDSKNPHGPALRFTGTAFAAFTSALTGSELAAAH